MTERRSKGGGGWRRRASRGTSARVSEGAREWSGEVWGGWGGGAHPFIGPGDAREAIAKE
jgi:hypothetical protein